MSTDWLPLANCRGESLGTFFPLTRSQLDARAAKEICRFCPVKNPCLEDALLHGDEHGIRGGLTEEERREVRSTWRQRVCEWCGESFMWEKVKYAQPPAFCKDECRRAQHLNGRAESYQRRKASA